MGVLYRCGRWKGRGGGGALVMELGQDLACAVLSWLHGCSRENTYAPPLGLKAWWWWAVDCCCAYFLCGPIPYSQVTGITALDALTQLTTLELGSNRIRQVGLCDICTHAWGHWCVGRAWAQVTEC